MYITKICKRIKTEPSVIPRLIRTDMPNVSSYVAKGKASEQVGCKMRILIRIFFLEWMIESSIL